MSALTTMKKTDATVVVPVAVKTTPTAIEPASTATTPKITQADLDDMIKNEVPSRFVKEWFGELLTKEDYDALINNTSSFTKDTTMTFNPGKDNENIDGKMSWLRGHDNVMALYGVAGNGEETEKNFLIPLKQSYVIKEGPIKGVNTLKLTQTISNTVSSEFGFTEGFELSYAPPATGGPGAKGTFSATQTIGFSTIKASTLELTATVNPEDTVYAVAPTVTYAIINTWSDNGWGYYSVYNVFRATGKGITIVAIQ